MNARQRRVSRKKLIADFHQAVNALTEQDVAEILKENLLLNRQISRFSNHMDTKFKLESHGGNWFYLVPADEYAEQYLRDLELE